MTEPAAVAGKITIAEYDPRWPQIFAREAEGIRDALGKRVLRIEHAGSTAVPGLAAKPVIDIVLVVADSREESAYAPELEAVGYRLCIREPEWYEHRMFKRGDPETNLHVFSQDCPEVDRMLIFRDWLRANAADRDLYARAKLALSQKRWERVQDYADAKTSIVEEIMGRALANRR
ncbi:MAG: GrpB family protein [Candidatus Acidiferrales bacterium]